jgi:fibro-slime domain-containing protein
MNSITQQRIYRNLSSTGLARTAALAAGVMIMGSTSFASASEDLPDTITLHGTARDFIRFDHDGGHPDFQQYNTGHVVGLVQTELGADGKPVRSDSSGMKVRGSARDSQGRNIMPSLYDASLGDTPANLQAVSSPAITSAESFSQWYRDVPGVNLSMQVPIVLNRIEGSSTYFFHAHDDYNTSEREGFFPIGENLFGDLDPTYDRNFFFTFELDTQFVVQKNAGQVFTFFGDDDVWVYINGQLVIDIGGVHGAVQQSIEIDRLDWLQDGQRAELKLFFAERHTTRSNFRVETNLKLQSISAPPVSALYD